MHANIVPLRRQITDPVDFFDWLINTKGYSTRAAGILVSNEAGQQTQHLLNAWELERGAA